jgi:acid phosphatase family membrane protein YuiD
LIGMQDLLTASFWIGVGSRVLATLTSARAAAIELFAIGGMPIAHQSVVYGLLTS